MTLEFVLQQRAFDVWVHEQDLRRALGKPGNLDSPGAHVDARPAAEGAARRSSPRTRRRPPNSAVVFDVHGPLEFLRTVRVDAEGRGTIDGSASLGPTVTLSLDWETYRPAGLRPGAARRRSPTRSRSRATRSWPQAILDNFAVTP